MHPARLQAEGGLLTRILTSMGTSIGQCGQLFAVTAKQ